MPRGGLRIGAGRPKNGEIKIKPIYVKQITEPIPKQCARCGETYTNKRHKYCSRECYLLASKEGQNIYSHICEKCGGNFNGHLHARYCSDDCYHNRRRRISEEGITEKQCPTCDEWKQLTGEFWHHSKQTSDGFYGICKLCSNTKSLDRSKTDHAKELKRLNRVKNIETSRSYTKKIQPLMNEREKIKSKTDPSFSLNRRMRCLMWAGLKKNKKGRSWQDLVGYSVDTLRHHLEKQFKNGMTWERFLAGDIHVDHKIPRAVFNYSTPEDPDFKRCWALKNLQPLWAFDNMSKGDKLEFPFQPSLAIGGRG